MSQPGELALQLQVALGEVLVHDHAALGRVSVGGVARVGPVDSPDATKVRERSRLELLEAEVDRPQLGHAQVRIARQEASALAVHHALRARTNACGSPAWRRISAWRPSYARRLRRPT